MNNERDYDNEGRILEKELYRLDAPFETKGGIQYSLWGRVSHILDERNSTIARLEADKARLVEALTNAVTNLEPMYRNDAAKWATMDVAQNYAKELVSDFRALLAEMEKSND